MKKTFYITTTIPYVNAQPHIGFALEVVQADVLARYKRLTDHEVFFNAGADEHGQKIWEGAQKAREDVQAYVDHYADSVRKLKETLNLSYDNFIRTTDLEHKKAAQELWRLCDKNGDIYKKKYKGLYCIGCERFLAQRDLVDGKCPIHPQQEPKIIEEENYFFKLSNYQKEITEYLKKEHVIVPPHRLKEAQQFVEQGLEDFSISREKEKLPWGVSVPNDDSQVMYVWFDALTNYISTLGWPEDKKGKYKAFWENGEKLQIAGKDQIRFQSIIWPAILMSAKLPLPDQIFYHGFINSGGQRMSKSLGNVINPSDLVEKYGVDATRYFLLRHVHPVDDTDITWERLDEWYEAHLVNGLGNLVARVMKMSENYLDNPVDVSEPKQISNVNKHIESFEFNRALDDIWFHITETDELIQKQEPFKLIKTNKVDAQKQVAYYVNDLNRIASQLESFLPETSEKIQEAIKENKMPESLFPRKT